MHKTSCTSYILTLLLFLLSFWPLAYGRPVYAQAQPQIVPGEVRFTEFHVVDVPVPKCLRFLIPLIMELVGKAWPAEVIKDPLFLGRAALGFYTVQFVVTPKDILDQMVITNKDVEEQPTTVAGRLCAYDSSGTLLADPVSSTRFQTENTDPSFRIEARGSVKGPVAATYLPKKLYSMEQKDFNQVEEPLIVDVENQLACEVKSAGDVKRDKDDAREGENIFIPGDAQAVLKFLEYACQPAICSSIFSAACCPCMDISIYYKATGLGPYDWQTACTSLDCRDEKMKNYLKSVQYEMPEKVVNSGGKVSTEKPSTLTFLQEDESPTGGADKQDMCTQLFGCIHTPQSRQSANSALLYSGLLNYCTDIPSALGSTYFNSILDDNPETPWDESQNACLHDFTKKTKSKLAVQVPGSTQNKEVPEQKAIDLRTITPIADAPTGKCADNMPATADEFLSYLRANNILWPDYDNIRAHYTDVINASKKAGIDPGLTMAIWIEESGAGRAGAQFGCTKVDPDFNTQLGCFVNLWNTYATDSRFQECRGIDGKLSMKEFMLIYSGGYKDCRSGNFDREPAFPEKIKDWYDKVTNCKDGLSF